ncbi:hypothetical protein L6164_012226 [Bauhinia variegata]|uniref:Uncharacterized protein n=1 Tax=Bauhinia variegata TaxID=167791 RepID=A0ACB9P9F4_BAUVA|nr:hypothetical protein L6164_012226 [Bauhinia variegata]
MSHLIGCLFSMPNDSPKFAQLYFYDMENEIQNRLLQFRKGNELDPSIIMALRQMLDQHNVYAKVYRMVRDRLHNSETEDIRLKLISERTIDGRIYNVPTTIEVDALIVGDIDNADPKDIIIEKRIHELHHIYLPLQYPLLFPYGEDGYRYNVPHRDITTTRSNVQNKVTIHEFFNFRLQMRKDEPQTILSSRRLFQQFIVDVYYVMESERLNYIRYHQKNLRVERYDDLHTDNHHVDEEGTTKGKKHNTSLNLCRFAKYMDQLYFDAMAICGTVGYPDIFLTFTCNPKWLEVKRLLDPTRLKPEDRLDINSHIFKIKLDHLMSDLKTNQVFDVDILEKELMNLTLCDIETMLRAYHKSLLDFPPIPFPTGYVHLHQGNSLIAAELAYDKQALSEEYNNLKSSFTGKTFLWRTLTATICSTSNIVIVVASSGIASLLLPDGRIAHSKFAIPVPTNQQSTCNIRHGSELAQLCQVNKLIIWDEAPMTHRLTSLGFNFVSAGLASFRFATMRFKASLAFFVLALVIGPPSPCIDSSFGFQLG